MAQEVHASAGLSRRSFLKTAGALAASSAVVAEASTTLTAFAQTDATTSAKEETVHTFCRGNCGSFGCPLDVKVREGKVVNVTAQVYPDLADPIEKDGTRACFRGYSNILRLYAPERLQYPLRRVEGTERGDGQYERITWEEAINEIATKWNALLAQYGGSSIARWTVYGSMGWIQGVLGIAWNRIVYGYGFATITSGADEAQIFGQNSWVNVQGIGSDGVTLAKNAKNIIMWGQNPAETLVHQWRWIIKAKQNGAKLITIDPRVSLSATKSDWHITPRYATDTALAMGCCNYLIQKGLVDLDFIAKKCNGANLVKPDGTILRMSQYGHTPNPVGSNSVSGLTYTDDKSYVWDEAQEMAVTFDEAVKPSLTYKGEVDGIQVTTVWNKLVARMSEWTVEKTCAVCGIDEKTLVDLAMTFVNGPTTVTVGNGAGHFSNSHSFFSATLILCAITGNFYKPGAGWSNSAQFADFIWVPDLAQGYPMPPLFGPSYASIDVASIVETQQYYGTPAPLKSILVHSANPIANVPNRKALIEAFKKLDFVVVADIEMSETCHYADIILPVGHWFEVKDVGSFQYIPFAIAGNQAVECMFERKSDMQMVLEIGKAMGHVDQFSMSEDDLIEAAVAGCSGPGMDGKPITWKRLQEEGLVRIIPDGIYSTGTTVQDGLLPLYLENPIAHTAVKNQLIDFEQWRMPFFEPPMEVWRETIGEYKATEQSAKYPLIFMSTHQRYMTHTSYNKIEWLRELRPEPILQINPKDAEARGIKNGEYVKIYNDRGFVVAKAQNDASLQPGSVNLPHGYTQDMFVAGHYQDLTSNNSDYWDDNECFFDCLVEVEKWNGGEA